MWKWIGGGCLVIVVIFAVIVYGGYKTMSKFAATGPIASVTIAGTPARVFAALATGDSLHAWDMAGMTARASRPGPLRAGDTIFGRSGDTSRSRIVWIVDTVVLNKVFAMTAVSLDRGLEMFRRRDSLVAAGDSTTVISTSAALFDSMNPGAPPPRGGMTKGMTDFAKSVGAAGMRMQAETELRNLKMHIEGKPPVVRPDSR